MAKKPRQPEAERFFRFVDKDGPNGCWLWTGYLDAKGRGRFRRADGKQVTTHRHSWEMTNGPIVGGLLVCHRCDNPTCVNPAHFFLGTQKDNLSDRDSKGRGIHGIRNGRAKLTEQQVGCIRADRESGFTLTALALRFNVAPTHIARVCSGRAWRHIA